MLLFISAQDIHEITIGIIEGGSLVQLDTYKADPEQYLEKIMKAAQGKIDQAEAVVVVLGPGSATALRGGVTIANAIGFARAIAVIGLENPGHLESTELVQNNASQIARASTGSFVPTAPVYDRPAV